MQFHRNCQSPRADGRHSVGVPTVENKISHLVERFHEIYLSSFRDVFRPAIAGRSAGPESITPAVVMDSGLAYAALRASHAPRNDGCC
jgi:hypothetical protein